MQLVFDIGGTHSRMAVSSQSGRLDEVRLVKTEKKYDLALDQLATIAREMAKSQKIELAAGGIPGPLSQDKQSIVRLPNLPNWDGKPFAVDFGKRIGCPVLLENDCVVAGLGEAVFGTGQGKSIVVYMTISTGVGGARIIDGKVDRNRWGFEPGHQLLYHSDKWLSLEELVSGTAIKRKYQQDPAEIMDKDIWDETAKLLAIGLNNVIVHWSPDVIILGGSVMKSLPVDRVRHHLEKTMTIFKNLPDVALTTLWDRSGLYGGLALIKGQKP